MKNISNLLVLEYSPKQGAFHTCTLDEATSSNIRNIALMGTDAPDYMVIGVFESREKLDSAFKMLEPIIRPGNVIELSSMISNSLLNDC